MFFFLLFIEKVNPPVCSTVALIAIPRPTASGLQSEREEQTEKYNFCIKGKKKNKIPSCQNRCTFLHSVLILKVLFMTENFLLWINNSLPPEMYDPTTQSWSDRQRPLLR